MKSCCECEVIKKEVGRSVKQFGFFKTPYVILTPKEENTTESVIIYCRSLTESFEQSLITLQVIVEIIKVPILCFEYPGFHEGSEYTKGCILGSLLDIHQLVNQFHMKNI